MKKHLLLVLLILPAPAFAQDCSGKIKLARASKAEGDYRKALAQFTAAAISCDESRSAEIEKEILDIYDRIEKLRNEALDAQKLAKTEEEKAKASERKAAEALTQVQQANRQTQVAFDSLNNVLEDLEKSSSECEVRLLLAEVERNQKAMNFDVAVDKIKAAQSTGALPDSVETAYLSLSLALLRHARQDLQRQEYKPALAKLKNAEELNAQPDSVAAIRLALQQFLYESARQDMLNTGYDNAAEKINALNSLQVPMDTITGLWFEIAFCYTETGQLDRAAVMLDTLAQMRHDNSIRSLLPELAGKKSAQQTQLLRKARQQLDPERDKILTARYLPPVSKQIPAGTIVLGSKSGDEAQGGCQVTVKPFLLAAKEMTFFEYDLFCTATNRPKPSDNGWGRGLHPVINIDWYDAVEYCNWRSRQEGLLEVYAINKNTESDAKNWMVNCNWSANGYRLPTEAEWEFAAGNGEKHTRYSWGNDLPTAQRGGNVSDETVKPKFPGSKIFAGYSDGHIYTAPAAFYPPNNFGLYDMTGNVWEWCWDWYDDNYCRANKNKSDPHGPSSGSGRVLRGGSWLSYPEDGLVSKRLQQNPDASNTSTGFRLARN